MKHLSFTYSCTLYFQHLKRPYGRFMYTRCVNPMGLFEGSRRMRRGTVHKFLVSEAAFTFTIQ